MVPLHPGHASFEAPMGRVAPHASRLRTTEFQVDAERASVAQCDRARQNATTCSSALFIGEGGNSASASTAMAP